MKYKFSQTLYSLIVFISQKIIIFCFRPKNKRLFIKNKQPLPPLFVVVFYSNFITADS